MIRIGLLSSSMLHIQVPCVQNSLIHADVCIMGSDRTLQQQNDTDMEDLEPQVIASAMAAFVLNNRKVTLIFHLTTPSCSRLAR